MGYLGEDMEQGLQLTSECKTEKGLRTIRSGSPSPGHHQRLVVRMGYRLETGIQIKLTRQAHCWVPSPKSHP